jgi:hypothetical protein
LRRNLLSLGYLHSEARAKLAQVKRTFDAKRNAMQTRVEEAMKASAAAWSDTKRGPESAWDELSSAVEEARSEFQDAEEKEHQSA